MSPLMVCTVAYRCELFVAVLKPALVRLDSRMDSFMDNEISLLLKIFATIRELAPIDFDDSNMLLLEMHI